MISDMIDLAKINEKDPIKVCSTMLGSPVIRMFEISSLSYITSYSTN